MPNAVSLRLKRLILGQRFFGPKDRFYEAPIGIKLSCKCRSVKTLPRNRATFSLRFFGTVVQTIDQLVPHQRFA